MSVDYNNFAKTFSKSRKNMKWEEIDYFISFLEWEKNISILDIWCGNWRFLKFLKENNINFKKYLWVDLSKWLLEEAKREHQENNFLNLNMLNIGKINEEFNNIFFIASFHHLDNLEDRLNVLRKAYDLLEVWAKIFMTNWALNSELNKEKYKNSIIKDSKNKFGSLEYNIKIWEFDRYYHCFDLSELEYLFKEVWFEIIENRLFDNKRNFISILRK